MNVKSHRADEDLTTRVARWSLASTGFHSDSQRPIPGAENLRFFRRTDNWLLAKRPTTNDQRLPL
jgi:hypothetical protein